MNETLVRALSGAVYVILLVTASLYSRESFLILFGLFLLQTVNEFCNITKLNKVFAILLAVLSYTNFAWLNNSSYNNWLLIGINLITSIFLLFWLFNSKSTKNENTAWGLLVGYIIIPFITIAKLGILGEQHFPHFVLGIFIIIWTNDTFAYLVGKSIGKHKLLEHISPKKTIEGFLGGVFFAIVASLVISKYYVTLLPVSHWIIITLITCIFGTLGDLIESKFKRVAGIKDSGNIMPGHGGILDRLDSIIYAAPIVYLYLKISGYVS